LARKKSPHLTEAELRLMDVLWEKGAATVGEVAEALPKDLNLAYNTVLTTMRILENKGYVKHRKASRELASRSALRYLMDRFFRNSAEALVLNLLDDEKLSEEELHRIRALLKEDAEGGTNE
jgi:predicted transcriptional regulator